MDFTLNNGLSMLGGDDFTTIQEEIDVLDASVVHKVGDLTESINGVKTFTSAFNVNTAGSVILTSDDIQLNNAVGNAGVDVNGTGVLMGVPSTGDVSIIDTTTFETLAKFSDTETIIRAPNGGSTLDIQGALMRIDGSSGGVNQLFFGAVNPFSSIAFQNTDMEFLNTDIVVSTDATDTSQKQIGISATSTTTGDLIFLLSKRTGTGSDRTASGYRIIREDSTGDFVLQRRTISSGGISTFTAIQRISGTTSETFTMPTQTKVATTAFKVQNVAGTDKLNIAPSTTTLTNTNIANVTTGSFVVQNPSGSNKVYVDSTSNQFSNTENIIDSSTGDIALLMGPTGALVVQNNTLEKLNVGTSETNLTNTTINFRSSVGGQDRFSQVSGRTTIENTSINATGSFYASNYRLGSSVSTNRRLASLALPGGSCLIPTASGSGTTTTTGTWSYTGTSTQMRTPDWGNFVPIYAIIGLDNGSITGGGTMTFAVQIREETNNFTIATTAQTLTSGTNNASTASSQNFNVYSSANQDIGSGVLVRFQIVISRTASITASTKSIFATIYGYQML
jgi:hypothetical protein